MRKADHSNAKYRPTYPRYSPSDQSIVHRPTIGWISDSVEWVDSLIDCLHDVPLVHARWDSMRSFLQGQRFCDAIVIDVGEVGNEQTMQYVANNSDTMIFVSGFSATRTQALVQALKECFPDHWVHYAGMNPDEFIRVRIEDIAKAR